MANAVYPKFKQARISGGANINIAGADLRAILVDLADYTYSAAHEFLSDVPAAARVATLGAGLGGITTTNGVVDASDATFSAVTGDQSEAIILYVHTGVEGTSRLVAFYDTGITGMPFTPSGGNLDLRFNASGLFGPT